MANDKEPVVLPGFAFLLGDRLHRPSRLLMQVGQGIGELVTERQV